MSGIDAAATSYVEQLENDLRLAAELGNLLLERNTALEKELDALKSPAMTAGSELLVIQELKAQIEALKNRQAQDSQSFADKLWEADTKRRDAEQSWIDCQQKLLTLREENVKLQSELRKLHVSLDSAHLRSTTAERRIAEIETLNSSLEQQLDKFRKELYGPDGLGDGSLSRNRHYRTQKSIDDSLDADGSALSSASPQSRRRAGSGRGGDLAGGRASGDGWTLETAVEHVGKLQAEVEQLKATLLDRESIIESLEQQKGEYRSLLQERTEALDKLREQLNDQLLLGSGGDTASSLSDQVLPLLVAEQQAARDQLAREQEQLKHERERLDRDHQQQLERKQQLEKQQQQQQQQAGVSASLPTSPFERSSPLHRSRVRMRLPSTSSVDSSPVSTSSGASSAPITTAAAAAAATDPDNPAAAAGDDDSNSFTLARGGRQSWERQSQQWAYRSARTKARSKAKEVTKWRSMLKNIRRQVSMAPGDGRTRSSFAVLNGLSNNTNSNPDAAPQTSVSASYATPSSGGLQSNRNSGIFDFDVFGEQFDEDAVISAREALFRGSSKVMSTASTQTDPSDLPSPPASSKDAPLQERRMELSAPSLVVDICQSAPVHTLSLTAPITLEPSGPTPLSLVKLPLIAAVGETALLSPTPPKTPLPSVATQTEPVPAKVLVSVHSQTVNVVCSPELSATRITAFECVAPPAPLLSALSLQAVNFLPTPEQPATASALSAQTSTSTLELVVPPSTPLSLADERPPSAANLQLSPLLSAFFLPDTRPVQHAGTQVSDDVMLWNWVEASAPFAAKIKATEERLSKLYEETLRTRLAAQAQERQAPLTPVPSPTLTASSRPQCVSAAVQTDAVLLTPPKPAIPLVSAFTQTTAPSSPSSSPQLQRAAAAAAAAAVAASAAADALARKVATTQTTPPSARRKEFTAPPQLSVATSTEVLPRTDAAVVTDTVQLEFKQTQTSPPASPVAAPKAVHAEAAGVSLSTSASPTSMPLPSASASEAPALRFGTIGTGGWFGKATKAGKVNRRFFTVNPWQKRLVWSGGEAMTGKVRSYEITGFKAGIESRFAPLNAAKLGLTLMTAARSVYVIASSPEQLAQWLSDLEDLFSSTEV